MPLRVGAATDPGRVRHDNEDSLLIRGHLAAVADGMGGHQAGEVASHTAITAIAPLAEQVRWASARDALDALGDAVRRANRRIYELGGNDPSLAGMGTTLTALLEDGTSVHIAHVGDSRAYLLRRGELSRLTEDHTIVAELVREGRIEPGEANCHPQRNVITRALGGGPGVEVETSTFRLQPGDRLMLCTDGLSGVVPEPAMRRVLRRVRDPQKAADRLVAAANDGGGPDNISVIVLDTPEVGRDDPTSEFSGPVGAPANGQPARAAGDARVVASSGGSPAVERAGDPGPGRPDTGRPAGWAPSPATPAASDQAPGAVVPPSPAAPAASMPSRRQRALDWLAARPRLLVGSLVLLLLVLAAAIGGRLLLDSRYFVGLSNDHVAIFSGVPGNLAGLTLANRVEETTISVNRLPGWEVDTLADAVPASSLADARAIVARIQARFVTPPRSARPSGKPRSRATRARSTPTRRPARRPGTTTTRSSTG